MILATGRLIGRYLILERIFFAMPPCSGSRLQILQVDFTTSVQIRN